MKTPLSSVPPALLSSPAVSPPQQQPSTSDNLCAILNLGPADTSPPQLQDDEDAAAAATTTAHNARQFPMTMTTSDPRSVPSHTEGIDAGTTSTQIRGAQLLDEFQKKMGEPLQQQQQHQRQPSHNGQRTMHNPPRSAAALDHVDVQPLAETTAERASESHPSAPQSAPLPPNTGSMKSPSQLFQSTGFQEIQHPNMPLPLSSSSSSSFPYLAREPLSSGYPATAGRPPPPFRHAVRPSQLSINGSLAAGGYGGYYSRDAFDLPGATADDATYPTPSLNDITLTLNADSGLDAWWSNVVQVLQTHYGADRATLAVPGDVTDLENVPWGQKATFHRSDSDPSPVSPKTSPDVARRKTTNRSRSDGPDFALKHDVGNTSSTQTAADSTSAKRPRLMGRHTFDGYGQHGEHSTSREPESSSRRDPRRRRSSLGTADRQRKLSLRAATRQSSDLNREKTSSPTESDTSSPPVDHSDAPPLNSAAVVFPVPRALEVEPDPLIKRTGVVKLFGRTKPTVLTREYVHDPALSPSGTSQHSKATTQPTPETEQVPELARNKRGAGHHSRTTSGTAARSAMADVSTGATYDTVDEHHSSDSMSDPTNYEEYEQPSPDYSWQSSAPNPGGLQSPEENNPFFRAAQVNEEAASSARPTSHDHAGNKERKHAGKTSSDSSKTVIHIPLLHSPKSKKSSPNTLRFPVAIVSFTSPITAYPSNWRRSLAYLLPHLTTSYGLAQQYSQLEKLLATSSTSRFGHILGLGGTFSDPSSELELVAGLSGHVNYPLGEENSLSVTPTLPSPPAATGLTRSSSVRSKAGILSSEIPNVGSRKETLPAPGSLSRQGSDTLDGHSKLKQSAIGNAHQKSSAPPKVSLEDAPSIPTGLKSRKPDQEALDELTSRDPGLVATPSAMENTPNSPAIPSQPQPQPQPQQNSQQQDSTRQSSNASNAAAPHQREPPTRPVPDTIAQLMLNSVPLHLFLAKPQTGELIWTNSKFDAYRRSHPQGPRVRDPWQNVHESEREILQTEWSRALKTGSQITERVRVKRFSDEGAYRWFIFRANPLLSGAGELLYWIGSFLDVHEQHVAEMKAAREREVFATDAKYRALANSIPQIVFEAAEFRGLIFANEQWHMYTGQSLDEAQNFGFAKYIHRDDLEKCGILSPPLIIPENVGVPEFSNIVTNSTNVLELEPELGDTSPGCSTPVPRKAGPLDKGEFSFGFGVTPALRELVENGVVTMQRDENGRDSYTTEIRFRSRGGEFRWHLVRLVKVENPFGNGEASWYGTCTDINDRKILERELNSAMHKLNKEMESKTNFFSNMSHELRTPLTGILGTIPFILETQLDNDQRRMLDTIQNSSTNLRELVDNILDVSRVEAGKVNIVHQWFHVRSMLEDVMDTIGSRAIDKGLELNYLVDIDVPAMVKGDRLRIRQVLINLVGNAVKFTSHGEIYSRCSIRNDPDVSLEDSELHLHFEVVDTGKGFSSKDAERLMQRFSQIEANGSQQHAGSGLGLFLSKQLVEMHGGRLTPTSTEGRGAKFSFFVRVGADPPSSSVPPPSVGKTILNTAGLPALRPEGPINTIAGGELAQSLVESPSQDYPVKSSLNIPDRSSQSDSSYTSASSMVSPNQGTSFPSTAASSPQKGGEQAVEQKSSENVDPPCQPAETYSVLIICPFDYAREATQQHIEQVIPLEVTARVTTLLDVEDWKEVVSSGGCVSLTHVVICWPDSNDVLEIMEHVLRPDSDCSPTLVVVADMYLKRQISRRYEEIMKTGTKVSIVPKPVKPSAFAKIFDPANKRDLSKDRNQDTARELNNSFKTMTKVVKEVIGNKGYRVLLVEDDETNRTVMLKYLEKVKLASDTAANGKECVDMVFSKEPGYYSLIICDIQMPVKNGYETCQEIRSWEQRNHFPEIPIMALSANAMMDQIDDAARAGFDDYVTKPIKHNELGKMIMELLDPSSPRVVLKDRNRKG